MWHVLLICIYNKCTFINDPLVSLRVERAEKVPCRVCVARVGACGQVHAFSALACGRVEHVRRISSRVDVARVDSC